jgi:hypothetical protein
MQIDNQSRIHTMQMLNYKDEPVNENISSPADVSSVNTPLDFIYFDEQLLNFHSADLPMLKIIAWFCQEGYSKKCHLLPSQWCEYLVKFGGKGISYRQLKKKWARLAKMKLIELLREHKNRNKPYVIRITELGINFLSPVFSGAFFKYKADLKREKKLEKLSTFSVDNACIANVCELTENGSNMKKVPLGFEKSSPPLTQSSDNKIRDLDKRAVKKSTNHLQDQFESWITINLLNFGLTDSDVLEAFNKYESVQLMQALSAASESDIGNSAEFIKIFLKIKFG